MTPEEVTNAVQEDADRLDLVVGPAGVKEGRAIVYLSAAHESAGTAIIESNGLELFSLYLDGFHWPEFAYEAADQRRVIHDLTRLAATHLFGQTRFRLERRRWRKERTALEVPWEGKTYLVTNRGRRAIT